MFSMYFQRRVYLLGGWKGREVIEKKSRIFDFIPRYLNEVPQSGHFPDVKKEKKKKEILHTNIQGLESNEVKVRLLVFSFLCSSIHS